MPTLSDFLGGQQGSPAAPQPGAGDPGFQQRKAGWMQTLQEMAQDPMTAGMLMQLGTSMANPRPGSTAAGQISGAMNDMMRFKGRYSQMQEDLSQTERKQAREDRRVDMEGRRADIAEEESRQRGLDRESRRELEEQRLGIARERLGVERSRVAASRQQKLTEHERLAQRISDRYQLEYMDAYQIAQDVISRPDRQAALAAAVTGIQEKMGESRALGFPVPTTQELVKDFEGIYGLGGGGATDALGTQPGPSAPVGGGDSQANPIQVATPDDLAELPEGTWVQAPDGRTWQLRK